MSRTKLLIDLIKDIRVVADDIQGIADALASDETAEEDDAQETIRLEDVRAVLAAKSRDGYGAHVRELIAKHGGSRLSEINPTEYAAMLKETKVFGNGS